MQIDGGSSTISEPSAPAAGGGEALESDDGADMSDTGMVVSDTADDVTSDSSGDVGPADTPLRND